MNRHVTVNDSMQKNYTYLLNEPTGKNFDPEFKPELTPEKHDKSLNFFGVDASQSLKEWEEKGWIYPDDPRGWFQWYCRYYLGRRLPEEDQRQIQRWKAIRRHAAQIQKHCQPGDWNCRRKQRQALLHWAYDSRNL